MRTSIRRYPARCPADAGLECCVSTALIDRWKDPSYSGPSLHKVLVVGVQKDPGRRRIWEDGMVAALTRAACRPRPPTGYSRQGADG